MEENNTARDLKERAADSRRSRALGNGRRGGNGPGRLTEPPELAQDEFDLLYSQVSGHRWDGWRRLTGDEDYFAACSCGWRTPDTGDLSLMLRQVKAHLDAVRWSRGLSPSRRVPARDGSPAYRRMGGEASETADTAREAGYLFSH